VAVVTGRPGWGRSGRGRAFDLVAAHLAPDERAANGGVVRQQSVQDLVDGPEQGHREDDRAVQAGAHAAPGGVQGFGEGDPAGSRSPWRAAVLMRARMA